MANIFQNILVSRPKRSVFDLSYENKLSFNMGDLVPMLQYDVVPGDKFKVNSEVFLRFAPMIAPVMHRVNCYVHYFFVPYRLVWDEWKEFITGGEDGTEVITFPRFGIPLSAAPNPFGLGTLPDYLGYNTVDGVGTYSSYDLKVSCLPFRAYQLIYNEYYRDQNLTPPIEFSKASGIDADALTIGTTYQTAGDAMAQLVKLRKRAWEKDYFTSALPWVQRGVASQLPITLDTSNLEFGHKSGDIDPVKTNAVKLDKWVRTDGSSATPSGLPSDVEINSDGSIVVKDDDGVGIKFTSSSATQNANGNHYHVFNDTDMNKYITIVENEQGVTITPPTINELRLAEHIQSWLEKNARGGARYIEQILSHFGVRVPDYQLQRPEYLGGGRSPVVISEVLQTSSTDDASPQGNMAGHAYSVGSKNKFNYTFNEHGIVLGIISVLPRTSYQQGISRHLTKFDKFDYYFPEFAHLGEQAIAQKEIFSATKYGESTVDPETTFGYQERYAEYKYRASEVHGDFKSSLDMWHLGRKFSGIPYLNTSFVESDPSNRIFSVETGQHLWCQVYNNCRAIRPMPKHSIPSL